MEGILSEVEIVHAIWQGQIVITPIISPDQIGPTIDIRLGTEFIIKRMDRLTHYDPVVFNRDYVGDPERIMRFYETVKRVKPNQFFVLHPGQFAIGCSLEYIRFSPAIGAQLEGKSSWAREGLNVHSTAGLIHPGHDGIIVFELHNVGSQPITLYPGARVAQLLIYKVSKEATGYGERGAKYSRYVTTSIGRPWEEWEFAALSERIKLGTQES